MFPKIKFQKLNRTFASYIGGRYNKHERLHIGHRKHTQQNGITRGSFETK